MEQTGGKVGGGVGCGFLHLEEGFLISRTASDTLTFCLSFIYLFIIFNVYGAISVHGDLERTQAAA